MDPEAAEEGLDTLSRIEEDIEVIKDRTATVRSSFRNGIFQGAGIIVGGALAVALVGWLLGILGIIPGLGDFAHYLQEVIERQR